MERWIPLSTIVVSSFFVSFPPVQSQHEAVIITINHFYIRNFHSICKSENDRALYMVCNSKTRASKKAHSWAHKCQYYGHYCFTTLCWPSKETTFLWFLSFNLKSKDISNCTTSKMQWNCFLNRFYSELANWNHKNAINPQMPCSYFFPCPFFSCS